MDKSIELDLEDENDDIPKKSVSYSLDKKLKVDTDDNKKQKKGISILNMWKSDSPEIKRCSFYYFYNYFFNSTQNFRWKTKLYSSWY